MSRIGGNIKKQCIKCSAREHQIFSQFAASSDGVPALSTRDCKNSIFKLSFIRLKKMK